MDGDPGQVIRSLRLALDMSQAEFARAAGWSPSTISSWERGRAKPSRLAFKTILAFAEERGVRYRPASASRALVVPNPPAPGEPSSAPRATLRPLVYDEPAEVQRFAAARALPSHFEAPRRAESPRWSAEASFRVTLGGRRDERRAALSRRLVEVAIVALGFGTAFALRDPVRHLLRPVPRPVTPATATTSGARIDAVAASVPSLAAVTDIPRHADVAAAAHEVRPDASTAASAAGVAPRDAASSVTDATARLESVMAVGGVGRATFRTANDAVTVVSGDALGVLRVDSITTDAVTLVDRHGDRRRVQVGQHTSFD